MFSKFQIITRYCSIEKPYAKAFLDYYKSEGLPLLHVLVQSEAEKDEIHRLCEESNMNASVTLYPEDISPDDTVKMFPLKTLDLDLPLCAMVDMDEYIHAQNRRNKSSWAENTLTWLEEHQSRSIKAMWHMNICDQQSGQRQPVNGFKGHQGKQISLTKNILALNKQDGFVGAHVLTKQKPRKIKSTTLVHLWSRSFQDSLLKVFFSRMKSFKTSDQIHAANIIKSGKIPNRLINLSFLASQTQSTRSPSFITRLDFDHNHAQEMLKEYISEDLIEKCYTSYQKYSSLLQEYMAENSPSYYPYPKGKPKDLRKIGRKINKLNLL